MKKTIPVTLILLFCLVAFFTQAFASNGNDKPKKTPGADETPEVETADETGTGVMAQHPGRKYNFKGEVTSYNGSELVISGKKGGTVTVDGNTVILAPGQEDGTAPTPTITVGQQVMAQAVKSDSGYLALKVHIFPQKAAHLHRVGVVTDYQPNVSITVQSKQGSTTFPLNSDVKVLPETRAGDLQKDATVTVVTTKDETTQAVTVTAIVVHPTKK